MRFDWSTSMVAGKTLACHVLKKDAYICPDHMVKAKISTTKIF